MKTNELIGDALDRAVARCAGQKYGPGFRPSTDWSQGGPIIEQAHITCGWDWNHAAGHMGFAEKRNTHPPTYKGGYTGPTTLVAAMRCYVAAHLGDEIDPLNP